MTTALATRCALLLKAAPLAALLTLASCSTLPTNALPEPRVTDGVRVEITSVIGTWTFPRGVRGTIENTTKQPIPGYYVRIAALGSQGNTLAQSSTQVKDLGPEEVRNFRMTFSGVLRSLHHVVIADARAQR